MTNGHLLGVGITDAMVDRGLIDRSVEVTARGRRKLGARLDI